jgi:hypothetical protein
VLRRPIETAGLFGTWPVRDAMLHARCGNFPRKVRHPDEKMSSEDNFRIADDSLKTFSFASRNAVSAPQRAPVRKTNWKYMYITPISQQYCWSARAGKAFSSAREFVRTDRAAQNCGRTLNGYTRSRTIKRLPSWPAAGGRPAHCLMRRQERRTKRAFECDALFSFSLEIRCLSGFARTRLTDRVLEFEDCIAWPSQWRRVQVDSPEKVSMQF